MNRRDVFLAFAVLGASGATLAFTRGAPNAPTPQVSVQDSALIKVHAEIPELPLVNYVRMADEIAQGRITGVRTTHNEQGVVYTLATMEVDYALKGAPPASFDLRIVGGTDGGRHTVSKSSPKFEAGQRVLVFIESSMVGARLERGVLGLAQGAYVLKENEQGRPEVVGMHARGEDSLEAFAVRVMDAMDEAALQEKR